MSKLNGDFSSASQRADAFEQAHFKCNKALGLSLAVCARYEEAFEAVQAQPPVERSQYMRQLAELLALEVQESGKALTAIGELVLAADNAPSWLTDGIDIEHMRTAFFNMLAARKRLTKQK
jgi:acyl-CoA reductase-like NAD-dependent aldehyde dehydrogenase